LLKSLINPYFTFLIGPLYFFYNNNTIFRLLFTVEYITAMPVIHKITEQLLLDISDAITAIKLIHDVNYAKYPQYSISTSS